MFSSAFSSAFARPVSRPCICPMSAQAALIDGASWALDGSSLLIDGKLLIGPAGRTFVFESADSAARWVEHTAAAGVRQLEVMAGVSLSVFSVWVSKKREKLAINAARLVNAASRQSDAGKRAALLAESDYCLGKWQ